MENSILCFTTVEPNNIPKLKMCHGGFEKVTLTSKYPGFIERISFDKLNQPQISRVPDGSLAYRGGAMKKEEDGSITRGFYIVDLKKMMQESYDMDTLAKDAHLYPKF